MGSADLAKKTSLFNEHKALGAKIVPFAGWDMPLQYSNIIEEHMTVREKAGLFDVSHMGQVFVSGTQAVALLQKLVPQDISKLPVRKAVYTQLTNENGGIIDDLIIYNLNAETFLLIINASRIDEDVNWIKSNAKSYDVKVKNKSDVLSMIALQGKEAKNILKKIGISEDKIPKRFFIEETETSQKNILIAATGYTGEDGFEIIVNNEDAEFFWESLLQAGEEYGLKPIGLAARDTLRLEAGLFLYGQDMTEDTTPVEASLTWTISQDKAEDYYGKSIITDQLNNKSERKKLVGFKMLDKSIPRHDYKIYVDGQEAGVVTSGGVAPSIKENIGLAYIDKNFAPSVGAKIDVMIREKLHPAEIVKRPFYTKK